MQQTKSRWLRRGVIPLLVLTLALPAAGIASAALLDSSLVPWFATGGASETASAGGGYTLTGAAGMAGAHLTVASGGNHTLYAGYVPVAAAVTSGGPGQNVWLPIVAGDPD